MPVLVTAVSANSAQCDKYEYKLMTLMKEKLQVQRASETATGFVDGPIWEEDVYDFRSSPSQKDFKAPNPASAFRVGTTTLYRVLTSSSTSEGGSHLPDTGGSAGATGAFTGTPFPSTLRCRADGRGRRVYTWNSTYTTGTPPRHLHSFLQQGFTANSCFKGRYSAF